MKNKEIEEITELNKANQNDREDAQKRAHDCSEEIGAILEKYQCRIMPRIDPESIEPVGLGGDKVQISATFWIAPLAT